MNIYTPYVYLIGWSRQDQYYIGSRRANNDRDVAHPSDLWTVYYTSSDIVHRFREEHGDPDVIQVLKTFADAHTAYKHESKLLRRLNAKNHPMLLNGHNNNGDFYITGPHSQDTKAKISAANKGRILGPRSGETKAKISAAKKGTPSGQKGKKRSIETRAKMSNTHKGKKRLYLSTESRAKMSAANKGKKRGPRSEDTKAKISSKRQGMKLSPLPRVICPHCGKEGGQNAMTRYHFDNCKSSNHLIRLFEGN
jgi:hypothetical protein